MITYYKTGKLEASSFITVAGTSYRTLISMRVFNAGLSGNKFQGMSHKFTNSMKD